MPWLFLGLFLAQLGNINANCTQIELRGDLENQLLDFADFGERERRVEVRVFEAELLVELGAQLACLHPRDDAGHETCRCFVGKGIMALGRMQRRRGWMRNEFRIDVEYGTGAVVTSKIQYHFR